MRLSMGGALASSLDRPVDSNSDSFTPTTIRTGTSVEAGIPEFGIARPGGGEAGPSLLDPARFGPAGSTLIELAVVDAMDVGFERARPSSGTVAANAALLEFTGAGLDLATGVAAMGSPLLPASASGWRADAVAIRRRACEATAPSAEDESGCSGRRPRGTSGPHADPPVTIPPVTIEAVRVESPRSSLGDKSDRGGELELSPSEAATRKRWRDPSRPSFPDGVPAEFTDNSPL
jgi:hypothetical protein